MSYPYIVFYRWDGGWNSLHCETQYKADFELSRLISLGAVGYVHRCRSAA